MRLESARSLKQELLHGLVTPFVAAASARAVRAEVARPPETARGPGRELALREGAVLGVAAQDRENLEQVHRSVALGVVPSARGQFRLAVRVQRQALLGSELVTRMVRSARGEAEVRFVGRLAKRAGAAHWYRADVRPLLIGASVGHVDVTAGSIGGFVTRGRAKAVYLLSNNHVVANEDRGKRGDAVIQPGHADRGRAPRDEVATLAYWIRFRTARANQVDVGLAELSEGVEYDAVRLRNIRSTRGARLSGVGPEFLDEGSTVYKVGRTTGATKGRVTAFDVDNLVISYDVGNLRFDDQIEIEGRGRRAFSDGGDSGSLIVDQEFRAVALLFAGGETGGRNGLGLTYANPVRSVLGRLRARLIY